MDFKVVTDDGGNGNDYSGDASYQLKDGAVLVVHHSISFREGSEPAGSPGRSVSWITTYGPSGWLRIEEAEGAPASARKVARKTVAKKVAKQVAKKVAIPKMPRQR